MSTPNLPPTHAANAPRARRRLALALALAPLTGACGGADGAATAPPRLADTGLWADPATQTLAAGVLPFEPQYPLWTDGARKRRWIALPPGSSIDASDVDHWRFPAGTRLWKEFTFAGGTEVRFMHKRADGSWLYTTYVGTGGDATLAPATGVPAFTPTQDGRHHDVPSIQDCRLCHESGRTAVLGFSALQLSPDRDPLAPNAAVPPPGAVDLPALVARGLLRNLPPEHLAAPPRTNGRSPTERAALGYLHGNCASCHNADGPLARLGLRLDHPLAHAGAPPALQSTLGTASAFARGDARHRIVAGEPAASTLFVRLCADDPLGQMPPFGRHLVDRAAAELIGRWIATDLPEATATAALTPAIAGTPVTTGSATIRKER